MECCYIVVQNVKNIVIEKKNSLNYFGIYQIFGGIIGILILLFLNYTRLNSYEILAIIISYLLYAFSIFCGYMILKGKLKKGINLSIINNFIQVLGFGALGFAFKFVSGISLSLNLDLREDTIIGLNLDVSNMQINLIGNSESIFININLIAIFVLYYLLKLKDKLTIN